MSTEVNFIKGTLEKIKKEPIKDGQILVATDTGKMFIDVDAETRRQIGNNIHYWQYNTQYKIGDYCLCECPTISSGDNEENPVIVLFIYECIQDHISTDINFDSLYWKRKDITVSGATKDALGRYIISTYATKEEIAKNLADGTTNKALYQLSEKTEEPNLNFNFTHLAAQGVNVPKGAHNRTTETGINAISLGTSLATGKRSFAMGSSNIAGGDNSGTPANVAMGKDNYAFGDASFALGYANYTEGRYSIATGQQTQAIGVASHTEGINTKAEGKYSHAEGATTVIAESGIAAHAEGNSTEASGEHSHAEGEATHAMHKNSHAGGFFTKTSARDQMVIGKYNADDPNALFIVGNGTANLDTSRSNAFVVGSDGTLTIGNGEGDTVTFAFEDLKALQALIAK